MATTYRLTASTAQPSTAAVELRCPGVNTQGSISRRCGRLLARAIPVGQTQQKCPRCGTYTTFTFSTDVPDVAATDRQVASI